MQTTIDFTSAAIRPHNNRGSELQAEVYSKNFGKQTAWVYEQLKKGRRLNGDIALAEYGIRDLRARIHTLRREKIDVKDEAIKGRNGMKEYFL